MRTRILLPLAVLMLVSSAVNQTQRKAASSVSPPHATWDSFAETAFGMSEDTFRQAGLSKLTRDEYGVLLNALLNMQVKAGQDAKKQQLTYVCGPIPAKYDKVKVMVDSNSDALSEIMSPLRQKLRAMPDVEIVFDAQQADFSIFVLPMALRNQAQYQTGYAASVVTYDSCQAQFGELKWPIQLLNNHWVFTAGTAAEVVDEIVSSVDTKDMEATRRLHASMRSSQSK